MMDKDSIKRKKSLEARLVSGGITDLKIQYLPYLDFDPESFASPFEVGCRIMILCAVNYAVHHPEDKPHLIKWLKNQDIWEHVSPSELPLFEGESLDQSSMVEFSWKIEAAYVLAWSLGLVSELTPNCAPMTEAQCDEFSTNIPALGDDLSVFLKGIKLIDKTQIIDENLFNELATTYFRNLYFNGKKDNSDIDRIVSFERHKSLNWLRRFSDIEEWDETDTST